MLIAEEARDPSVVPAEICRQTIKKVVECWRGCLLLRADKRGTSQEHDGSDEPKDGRRHPGKCTCGACVRITRRQSDARTGRLGEGFSPVLEVTERCAGRAG